MQATGLIVVSSHSLPATPDFLPEASAYNAYVDSNILFAFELAPSREAFIEVINSGRTGRCLSVDRITLRTAQGQPLRFDSFLYDGRKSKAGRQPPGLCSPADAAADSSSVYNFEFPGKCARSAFLVGRLAYRLQPVSGADYRKVVENSKRSISGSAVRHLKKFQLRVALRGRHLWFQDSLPAGDGLVCQPGTRGPVTLLSTFPRLTPKAKRKKTTGSLSISLKLDAKGEVVEAVPESSLEFGLTERAVYEVRHWWDFAPAYRDGKPLASQHRAKVVYRTERMTEIAGTRCHHPITISTTPGSRSISWPG